MLTGIYIHKPVSAVGVVWLGAKGKYNPALAKPRHLLLSVARVCRRCEIAVPGIACSHIDFSGWWQRIASSSGLAVKDDAFMP